MNARIIIFPVLAGLLTASPVLLADSARLQFAANKHYYQQFDNPTTWLDAVNKCRNLATNSHLVTIGSAIENAFVTKMTSGRNWLGASLTKTGDVIWVNGDSSTVNYNDKSSSWGDHFNISNIGTWQRGDDTQLQSYVCEWD